MPLNTTSHEPVFLLMYIFVLINILDLSFSFLSFPNSLRQQVVESQTNLCSIKMVICWVSSASYLHPRPTKFGQFNSCLCLTSNRPFCLFFKKQHVCITAFDRLEDDNPDWGHPHHTSFRALQDVTPARNWLRNDPAERSSDRNRWKRVWRKKKRGQEGRGRCHHLHPNPNTIRPYK